jgi:hypothetical protein
MLNTAIIILILISIWFSGKQLMNSVPCCECDINCGIIEEFCDEFGFFTYVGKFCPFGE